MKHTHLFRTMLAVVLATAFALSVGAFTPENVETAAEVETALPEIKQTKFPIISTTASLSPPETTAAL